MKYSILVATMNRPGAVAAMLKSVENQTFLPQEMILVDQSKDDQTKAVCEDYARRVASKGQTFRYVRQEVPSLVKARNRGVDESTGDIICFIDDDVILDRDYFEKIIGYFKDPTVGGVTGNVYVQNPLIGFKWELRKFLTRIFLLNNYKACLTPSTFGYPIYEREIDKVMEVELFSGYSMNFRRELVIRNRPDEWFSGYGFREDVDFSYRISREARMILVPDARFVHDVSTINRLDTGALKKMQYKNYYYMMQKFSRYGILGEILFYYSLSGIVFMDFLEFLSGFKAHKWEVFKANFSAIREMTK